MEQWNMETLRGPRIRTTSPPFTGFDTVAIGLRTKSEPVTRDSSRLVR